ncbi:alpha/beta fold hydrolase [Fodinicola acaciae]|uniref:alpha/beta fold hydrolase n=1 Tax=Fodinicola acaciae TaxID=2681555 RepID=UPI0013D5BE48|nr:alpha/beta hydrolase [Fodinicola acaciae]
MSTVTSTDGTTIAYTYVGSGPAVILVGGAFQHRAIDASTREVAQRLGEDFTVFHYDRRGRGESSDTQPYAKEREIEDLAALIAEAGGRVHLYGMSSGAALALDAVAAGLDVASLAVYEAPFVVDDSRPPFPDNYLEHLTALCRAGDRDAAVAYFLTNIGVPADLLDGMRQAPIWSDFEGAALTLAYDAAFMDGTTAGTPLPADRWSKVTVPALVMHGGASPDSMRTAAEALTALLPAARHEVLAGQQHDVATDVLVPALRHWLSVEK